MSEIVFILSVCFLILAGFTATIERKRRRLATKLNQAQYDRRMLWEMMRSARQAIIKDIHQYGEVTDREAFWMLVCCWNIGVYDRDTLNVSSLIAQAIVEHLAPARSYPRHHFWHEIIFTIAKGDFEKAPWGRVEPFEIT